MECTRLYFPTIRGHPLLRVSVQVLAALMRDVRWFFMYHNSRLQRITAMRFRRRFRNSREVSQFYHLPGMRPETIHIVPIPDALVSRTCVTGNLSRGPSLLSSLSEMRYLGRRGEHAQLFVSCGQFYIFVCGLVPKRLPKDQHKVLRELGYSDKIHRWSFFYTKNVINYLKNILHVFFTIYFIFRY